MRSTFHQYNMHPKLLDLYNKQRKSFWLPTDPDLTKDRDDLLNMDINMSKFAKFLSAFFAVSDNLVNINLGDRINNFVEKYIPEEYQYEVNLNFHFQVAIEDIHSEQYSLFLENYCNNDEKEYYINSIKNFPTIKEKSDFILNIIKKNDNNEYIMNDPLEFIVSCMCVERIGFSASFAGAFYFRTLGILNGFTNANELISRDEGMHCDVLGVIYEILYDKSTQNKTNLIERIHNIVRNACDIEKRFAKEALPERLPNMNENLMCDYAEYISDHLLTSINIPKLYNTKNPFNFMDNLSLPVKTSFFEKRVTQYSRGIASSAFSLDEDI